MRPALVPTLVLAAFGTPTLARAQVETETYVRPSNEEMGSVRPDDPYQTELDEDREEEERRGVRGFLGGLLGLGFSLTNKQEPNEDGVQYDTSLLFAATGGLRFGHESLNELRFEVSPLANRITWELRAAASGFVTYARFVPFRKRDRWYWVWRLGPGVGGGGGDIDFFLGAQLDLLTFAYDMSDRVQIELGLPTFRFYIETQSDPIYAFQFVFPLTVHYMFR